LIALACWRERHIEARTPSGPNPRLELTAIRRLNLAAHAPRAHGDKNLRKVISSFEGTLKPSPTGNQRASKQPIVQGWNQQTLLENSPLNEPSP